MEDTRLKRIEKWLKNGYAEPWHMQLQPTARCNLRCKFCWSNKYKRREPDLSDEKWKEITREACEIGVKALTIVGGGEPLIRINLVREMTKMIKDYNIDGTIVTNGTLITSEFAKHLVDIRWDTIAISIHGVGQTDNYLRGSKKAFQMTMNSIKLINKHKKAAKSDKPNIVFHGVITRQNVKELVELFMLAKKCMVGTFVLRMVNDNLENPRYYITKNQYSLLESQIKEIVKLSVEYGIDLDWQMSLEDVKNKLFGNSDSKTIKQDEEEKDIHISCVRPFTEMVVIPDGTVGPCCAFCEGKYSRDRILMENVLKFLENVNDKSLNQIWRGEKFNDFRELAKNGKLPLYCERTCPADYIYLEKSGKLLYR
ncbi:MAG: radical SAM/SPASM domain-containing protein [Candidatus Aenigmatarchaeota archaeon]